MKNVHKILLFCGVLAIVYTVRIGEDAVAIVRDRAVWDDPRSIAIEVASNDDPSDGMLSLFGNHSYSVPVRFEVAGNVTQRKVRFRYFGSVDPNRRRVVRYDPDDPSRFALNLAVDQPGARWMGVLLDWGFWMACFGLISFVGLRRAAKQRLAERTKATWETGRPRAE